MEIQPIVIGTAGHIDHGKSTLVRALTGIDPDRLKEEKERGMTIDLGFARFELPDGRQVGIVDVPGHERFIRNMVAGATGIDLVLLVVAADDGVMPQTREHLSIMEILGVRKGLVALTKVDLVDDEMVDLAEEDVRETVSGTFLEGAPILRMSAVRGEGIEELRSAIAQAAAEVESRSDHGPFRMPVQRIFSARGFGTILTGIPVSGSVRVGDVLEVQPGGMRGKVRGIQAYHEQTDRARAGHSTALNLADVDHHTVQRGAVVARPGYFQPLRMVGARLRALATNDRPVMNRAQVRVHTGTVDALGEVVLLDVDELEPGGEALVQFRLEEPLVCAPGDRFVLRLASPVVTLGGGVILEESRHRLKRFKSFVIDELGRQEGSLESPRALLETILFRSRDWWVPIEDLAVACKLEKKEALQMLEGLQEEGRVRSLGSGGRWIHADVLTRCIGNVEEMLEKWFEANPLRQVVNVREIRQSTSYEAALLSVLLEELQQRGRLELETGGQIRPQGRTVEMDAKTSALREKALSAFQRGGFQPPSIAQIADEAGAVEGELAKVIQLLVDEGQLVHVGGDLYLDRPHIDEARAAVEENCQAHGKLEIPKLRDRLGTTRKFLIPILEHFDAQGITLRQGGHRVLRRR